ncbi:type III pantothenate kinase [Pedobacter cryoconitis]|nr:type III pantothenate kinase [Pedobacter cryoconitis]
MKKADSQLIAVLKAKTNYLPFSTNLNTGINNYYKTISTLGQDRWAKIIAVHHAYPQQNCLVIDAGTCITYDLLNNEGAYYGGSISLGLNMRFNALNHYTGKLPLVKWDRELENIPSGTDTETAIINGVLQGVINEVEGFITLNAKNNKELKVVITGGDATFLLEQLKNSIFAPQIIHDPYLVLKGLNEVIAFEYVQKN